ncbi:MAG TPA: hypothetical protein VML92_09605, partial [Steroidobacteraceae bacterium]|nr:hypothetical protein [Steroidobacteraceae bacterium]
TTGLMVTAACASQEAPMHEASINFDLENVQPFLTQLDSTLLLGLPAQELVSLTQATPPEDETSQVVAVSFGGSQVRLEYRVFMDDIDAPDLSFRTESKVLADAIQVELMRFADAHGM